MNISFEYSAFWIFPIVLISFFVSAWLYYKELNKDEVPRIFVFLLALLRFFVISLIGILFLVPRIESFTEKINKPVLIVALDKSESLIANTKDKKTFKLDIKKSIENLINKLSHKFEIKNYSFGGSTNDSINYSFLDQETNIASFFRDISSEYSRND